jgi:hypothetical protein
MRANPYYKKCFHCQRAASKRRGIPFDFSYAEWMRKWRSSGHLRQRGTMSGNYVMGRHGDRGAYTSSNVRIVTVQQNVREAAENRRQRGLTAASSR